MLEFSSHEGKIRLGPDRMLIFRQAAFGVLRALLFERLGVEMTHSVLAQFGHRCGQGDYHALTTMFEWDTDDDCLAAGPILHSWEGVVLAKPEHIRYDRAEGIFHMYGTWESSYEAETHREHIGESSVPTCFTLAGYASGYASAFMGRPMLCVEAQCVAAGATSCRWEIKPAEEWDARADPYRRALASTDGTIHKELERSLDRLSTPLLRVWDGVLAMPIIGTLDARRTATITATLLEEVIRSSARSVILDVTGVETVDAATADGLLRIVSAVELLGAQCHLSGMRGEVARTLSASQINLGGLRTFATVRQALRHCLPLTAAR
ncbi:XylR N-terminal domain-containing protein [Polyangium sp. 6x1]|uniref:XylR N-terminal domain-containing protein n=1 Tax=Polyangium sp. 6x1 TaxID=3042689 RepID=UPI002482FCF0|nr:XylR N-terminal domain-containing protein [Polyangium sp. 6x1]MDI1443135.1 XylR N-terminal domain-containing protein [Polyangium sp. 6x1]